eukprot:3767795-Pyramimonas_sp.AAC.1
MQRCRAPSLRRGPSRLRGAIQHKYHVVQIHAERRNAALPICIVDARRGCALAATPERHRAATSDGDA